ncbi:TPA: hypothetical protein DIS56_03225 [Candidatus Saccharibacteria bacterium]|nr:MAG: hypothetical protein A3F05_02095 [Candidatus Saccharibacteria bacterium RIFCSPHIGHO2_12_FULL_47_17]HCM52114.1 hypothetical protein [Candidatus Saccharibacteria bacterium]
MTEGTLLALIFIPVASVYFLKSSGVYFFFSICASFVLVSLASDDIGNLLHRTNISSISSDSTNLILVFAPALLTLLLARKLHRGQLQMILGLIAAACGAALMVLITAPFLGTALPPNAFDSPVWNFLQNNQSWLISAGALASFISLWSKNFSRPSFKRHK